MTIKTSDEIADLCDRHNIAVHVNRSHYSSDAEEPWTVGFTLNNIELGVISTDGHAPSLDSAMCQAWEKMERLIRADNSGTFLKELPAPEERPNDLIPPLREELRDDEIPF